jgi:precorrin-2 dehydrogenase/sirohydrochlorin ferrochelatase
VNLDVRGRKCVVFGGGHEGEVKVLRLCDFGADVTVISDEVSDAVQKLADDGKITWARREYQPGDLEGAFIAIAALPEGPMARQIADEAKDRNVPINVVDVTHLCTFIFPSMVQRGDVVATFSTGGASPALARKFREVLNGNPVESRHPIMDYAELAPLLADVRNEARKTAAGRGIFTDHWQACITDSLVDQILDGKYEEARNILLDNVMIGASCNCQDGVCKMWEEKKAEAELRTAKGKSLA